MTFTKARIIKWANTFNLIKVSFKCGYCGEQVSPSNGYSGQVERTSYKVYVYICHFCAGPTFIDIDGMQYPGPIIGSPVKNITDPNVEDLLKEAKLCFSVSAYTAAVMCCRKLLMNISVSKGAEEGKGFAFYVDWLDSNNYIPPDGKAWVEFIKDMGNEANHVINPKNNSDAEKIINFTEHLLRTIYEIPGLLGPNENSDDSTNENEVYHV